MTAIELAIFVGWPSCLAFCFVYSNQAGLYLAFMIGAASATAAALVLFVSGALLPRSLKSRLVSRPFYPDWSAVALALAGLTGFGYALHLHASLPLGVSAFLSAFMATSGPERWRKASLACFAMILVLAIILFVSSPV